MFRNTLKNKYTFFLKKALQSRSAISKILVLYRRNCLEGAVSKTPQLKALLQHLIYKYSQLLKPAAFFLTKSTFHRTFS